MRASRREVLQFGAALTALPLHGSAAFAAQRSPDFASMAVYEAASDAAGLFAARCRRSGVAVAAIRDDVTQLWREYLEPAWREQPLAIAGLTRWPALFCLDELARTFRLSVIHHAVHRIRAPQAAVHETIVSPAAWRAAELDAAAGGWPQRVAELLAQLPLHTRAALRRVAYMPRAIDDDLQTLHSWIIAPATGYGRT